MKISDFTQNNIITSVQRTILNNDYIEKLLALDTMEEKRIEQDNNDCIMDNAETIRNTVNRRNHFEKQALYNELFVEVAIVEKAEKEYEQAIYETLEKLFLVGSVNITNIILHSMIKQRYSYIDKKTQELKWRSHACFDSVCKIINSEYTDTIYEDLISACKLALYSCHKGINPKTLEDEDFYDYENDIPSFYNINGSWWINYKVLKACFSSIQACLWANKQYERKTEYVELWSGEQDTNDGMFIELSVKNKAYNAFITEQANDKTWNSIIEKCADVMNKLKASGKYTTNKLEQCRKILACMASGNTIIETSKKLEISRNTVAKYRNIMADMLTDEIKHVTPTHKTLWKRIDGKQTTDTNETMTRHETTNKLDCVKLPKGTIHGKRMNKLNIPTWYKDITCNNREFLPMEESAKKALQKKAHDRMIEKLNLA